MVYLCNHPIFSLKTGESNWLSFWWLALSLAHLGLYAYQHFYQYLTIKNGFIKEQRPLSKKISLSEIKQIKKASGDYFLKTDTHQLNIHLELIDPDSLSELDSELKKLKVKWV